MNKVIIVDAPESDSRLMSGLLTRAGYEPITVDKMDAAKDELAKLPPGAVVVAAMKFTGGTGKEQVAREIFRQYTVGENKNPSNIP